MTYNVELAKQVELNLVHYNLWSEVQIHEIYNSGDNLAYVLSGIPPDKLDESDENGQRQWVKPYVGDLLKFLNIQEINLWFTEIAKISNGARPKKITIALVNDDSTVVYYFIHDGVVKPRQN